MLPQYFNVQCTGELHSIHAVDEMRIQTYIPTLPIIERIYSPSVRRRKQTRRIKKGMCSSPSSQSSHAVSHLDCPAVGAMHVI